MIQGIFVRSSLPEGMRRAYDEGLLGIWMGRNWRGGVEGWTVKFSRPRRCVLGRLIRCRVW